MATEINNFHQALVEALPERIKRLKRDLKRLEEDREDMLSLLQDYKELLVIGRRRAKALRAARRPKLESSVA